MTKRPAQVTFKTSKPSNRRAIAHVAIGDYTHLKFLEESQNVKRQFENKIDSFVAFGVISAYISHDGPDLKGVFDFLIAAVCHFESQNHTKWPTQVTLKTFKTSNRLVIQN